MARCVVFRHVISKRSRLTGAVFQSALTPLRRLFQMPVKTCALSTQAAVLPPTCRYDSGPSLLIRWDLLDSLKFRSATGLSEMRKIGRADVSNPYEVTFKDHRARYLRHNGVLAPSCTSIFHVMLGARVWHACRTQAIDAGDVEQSGDDAETLSMPLFGECAVGRSRAARHRSAIRNYSGVGSTPLFG